MENWFDVGFDGTCISYYYVCYLWQLQQKMKNDTFVSTEKEIWLF